MKKIFYSILAAAAIVASCAKEPISEPVSPSGDGSSVFTGTIIQPGGIDEATKVSIIDQTSEVDKVFIKWTSGDQIHIIKRGSDEWNSTTESTKPKVFSAASSEATTQFTGNPPTDWIAPGATYEARYYGKEDVWKEYVLAGEPVEGITINCNGNAEAAFLENMPLSCGESSYDASNFRYNFTFSNAYAILQINVPSKLDFKDLYVCVNAQNVEFESGQLTDGSKYTLCLKNADAVKSTEKYTNKDRVTYFVPVSAGNYNKLTIVAAKDNAEVARMETYVGNVKNGSDSPYVLPQLYSNNIYPFDFCNTKTIEVSNTSDIPYELVSSNGIDYKVNVTADIAGDVYITTPTEGSKPANIYLNLRGHQIGTLYINGTESHVEGENGIIVNVEAQTSNSTFVVKPSLTITGLTVKKGSVKVEGKDNKTANVTTITIPSEVKEQIKIDVSGVSSNDENGRVKIVNNSETPVVVVPDKVGDEQKSYKVEQGPVTPVSKETVAKIGDAEYETLAAAITAATAGQTIKLVSNIALDKEITISKGITIDGNNFTIAVSDAEYWNQYKIGGANQGLGKVNMISVEGNNFTLKNVTLDGKACRGVSLCTTKGGKDILYQNITYTGRGSGHYYGEAAGLVTFDKCKFDIHGYAVHFGGESSPEDDVVIKNCEINGWSSFGDCKSLTISDSHFGGANDEGKNGWLAVLRPYCPTTITNCTFSDIYLHEAVTGYDCIGLGTGAATTVTVKGCKIVNGSKQEITGAEIYSIVRDNGFDNQAAQNGSVFAFDATGDATDGYTAGTFYAVDPTKIKLQSGYEYYAIEGKTNIYGIREAQGAAAIKTQAEFVTACAAAKNGDKLVLGNGEFAIGPVDINGKTLTFKGQGAANTKIYIGNGGYDGNGGHGSNKTANMTFEDVTLDDLASDAGYLTGFTEAAGLTFRNVTFNVGFSNWGNKGGDVSFYNCTFNQKKSDTYCVQELRCNPDTKFLFDNCRFICTGEGRFINAYTQYGGANGVEIVVKDCTFDGSNSTQKKAALNLKSGSNGCPINCYFLGRNTVNNVKVQHAATGSALFADEEGNRAKVYVGTSKETAVLIWENQAQTEQYIKPEDFNPES